MKILVLGGSGFIGSHVVDFLKKENHSVFNFDLIKPGHISKDRNYIKGNILDYSLLRKSIKGKDIIFNFAAIADIDKLRFNPMDSAKVNILGLINILNACKDYKIKRIIHASSVYANSQEGGFYSISKRASEDYITEFNDRFKLKYTILRFGSLYGERADENNGIKKILKTLINKKILIHRGSKKASRKYIHVLDAAKACVNILRKQYENKCVNIIGKKTIKIIDLFNFLSTKIKIKKKFIFLNEKNTSHYDKKPSPYILKKGENFIIKEEKNFKKMISKLIIDLN